MRIFTYDDYADSLEETIEAVGNKAIALFDYIHIAKIPDFCVLGRSILSDLLAQPENIDIKDELIEAWACKTKALLEPTRIKAYFHSITIPSEWKLELDRILKIKNIRPPYAIRSSSVLEDTSSLSGAGAFESFLFVSKDNLWDKILDCISSIFMPNALSMMNNSPGERIFCTMAVIIQEAKECELSGVMFTSHPTIPDAGILVEYSARSRGITDGGVAYKSLVIRNDIVQDEDVQDRKWLYELVANAKNLRKNSSCKELDIEWGISDGKLFIFQIRPITIKADGNPVTCLIRIDEISTLSQQQLLSLSGKYKSWKYKKAVLYQACRSLGIRALEWYIMLVDNADDIDKMCKEAVNCISSEFVHVMFNDILIDCVVQKEELLNKLRSIALRKGNQKMAFSLREMRENRISAISTYYNKNDTVLIEALPGAMTGLKSGSMTPAKYLVNALGIVNKMIPPIHEHYRYNIAENRMELVESEIPELLEDNQVKNIYRATKNLYNSGIIGALEWWYCENELIVTDISLTDYDTAIPKDFGTVISPGLIYGKVLQIENSSVGDTAELSYSNAISVQGFDKSLKGITVISKWIDKIRELKKNGERVIIKTEQPILALAPILLEADGVIFREASLLCHLSIILRENAIPAAIVGDTYENISEGEEIRL
jgi:hypothetical protein